MGEVIFFLNANEMEQKKSSLSNFTFYFIPRVFQKRENKKSKMIHDVESHNSGRLKPIVVNFLFERIKCKRLNIQAVNSNRRRLILNQVKSSMG